LIARKKNEKKECTTTKNIGLDEWERTRRVSNCFENVRMPANWLVAGYRQQKKSGILRVSFLKIE